MSLKLSRSMSRAATGRAAAARSHEHLLDAVDDESLVGEPGQCVVGRDEGELGIRPLALRLEALAHSNEGDIEGVLHDRHRLVERRRRDAQLALRSRPAPRRPRRASADSASSPRSAARCAWRPAGRRSERPLALSPGHPRDRRRPSTGPAPSSRLGTRTRSSPGSRRRAAGLISPSAPPFARAHPRCARSSATPSRRTSAPSGSFRACRVAGSRRLGCCRARQVARSF